MLHGANTGSSRNGPAILRAAQRHKGLILFEDEASFASGLVELHVGAARAATEVKTSGNAKATKCLVPLSMARDACFIRVSRVGLTRKVTKGLADYYGANHAAPVSHP